MVRFPNVLSSCCRDAHGGSFLPDDNTATVNLFHLFIIS